MSTDGFSHPGMLHGRADLERMQRGVKNRSEPIYSGFLRLQTHPHSQLTYKRAGASEEVGRNPTVRASALESDANAAYQLSLIGSILESRRHLELSASILNDWATTLKRITGADAALCAGLAPFKMANAAEILRANDNLWPVREVVRFGEFLRDVVLPVISNFAPFANGNWDTAALKTMIAIAIYNDDRELLERALVYYNDGCGDGRLGHYIYPSGQCQESGRDQQHTQLGLAHLGDCCEMVWHQGLNLYGMLNNRLLTGFEYTAKYGCGEDVSFSPDVDQTGKYRHQVISPRSALRPVYEQIYNHYVNRCGLSAPWTAKAAEHLRPEGPGFGADHTGFGTLLYSREPGPDLHVAIGPAGVFTTSSEGTPAVNWVPMADGGRCSVLRKDAAGSTSVLPVPPRSNRVVDGSAKMAERYSYRVMAGRRSSLACEAVAGLPQGWEARSAAVVDDASARCNGDEWRISGTRTAATGNTAYAFVRVEKATGDRISFTATLSPLFASQAMHAGLGLCGKEFRNVPEAMVVLEPVTGKASERGGWALRFYCVNGDKPLLRGEHIFTIEAVQYGRVIVPLTFRLDRNGTSCKAFVKYAGVAWTEVGAGMISAQLLNAALLFDSGFQGDATGCSFEQVAVTPLG